MFKVNHDNIKEGKFYYFEKIFLKTFEDKRLALEIIVRREGNSNLLCFWRFVLNRMDMEIQLPETLPEIFLEERSYGRREYFGIISEILGFASKKRFKADANYKKRS